LVFDINDFDETLPGPFEWDVKRLAASFVVAGRDNGFTKKNCRKAALAAVESYRTAMRAFATQSILTVWYAHLNIEEGLAEYKSTLTTRQQKKREADFKAAEAMLAKAHTRDSLQATRKLTTIIDGKQRIISDPPLIVRLDEMTGLDTDEVHRRLRDLIGTYRVTLQSDRRHLLDHFTLADVAHKVVGVGSVGTRAWILLFEAGDEAEVLLLQANRPRRLPLPITRVSRNTPTRESAWWLVSTSCRLRVTSSSAGFAHTPPAARTRTTTCASSGTGNCPP
jgi:uncharacterized protein (DUF2252 family)